MRFEGFRVPELRSLSGVGVSLSQPVQQVVPSPVFPFSNVVASMGAGGSGLCECRIRFGESVQEMVTGRIRPFPALSPSFLVCGLPFPCVFGILMVFIPPYFHVTECRSPNIVYHSR